MMSRSSRTWWRGWTEADSARIYTPSRNTQCISLRLSRALYLLLLGGGLLCRLEEGDAMYIVGTGFYDVSVSGEVVTTLGPGSLFGELALLFSAPRNATVSLQPDENGASQMLGRSPNSRPL